MLCFWVADLQLYIILTVPPYTQQITWALEKCQNVSEKPEKNAEGEAVMDYHTIHVQGPP